MELKDKQDAMLDAYGFHEQDPFICYTDGACDNNGSKIGGAAYLIYAPDGVEWKQSARGFTNTTNNRMEMLAIISAIASLPQGANAIVRTDSQYSIGAFTKGGSANQDLIEKYRMYAKKLHDVTFEKVKGHSGEPSNEFVDRLANDAYVRKCAALNVRVNSWVVDGFPKKR